MHQNILKKLLFVGTKMRHYYRLVLGGIWVIRNEGWHSFSWKARRYIIEADPRRRHKVRVERISIPKIQHAATGQAIDATVSVIIPTKNAGLDFEYVLNKLKSQRGIPEPELVVVDSGSTDETMDIARKYGAKIYQIAPGEFGHGRTRNYAANQSTGEYLLFTTQDALLSSEYSLRSMLDVLRSDPKIAAVSCTQVPRSDANLMACFQIWNHYNRFMGIKKDTAVFIQGGNSAWARDRRLANLSNSCCCIRWGLFSRYRFKADFAEDLELGIRLLADGYKLAYLASVAIIHSHNRSAAYFFKASYADAKLTIEMGCGAPCHWPVSNTNTFYAEVKRLYERLNVSMANLEHAKFEVQRAVPMLKGMLAVDGRVQAAPPKVVSDASLDELFACIESIIGLTEREGVGKPVYGALLNAYLGNLDSFNEYIRNYEVMSPRLVADFKATLYKLFAGSVGSMLANFFLFLCDKGIVDDKVGTVDRFVSGSV